MAIEYENTTIYMKKFHEIMCGPESFEYHKFRCTSQKFDTKFQV